MDIDALTEIAAKARGVIEAAAASGEHGIAFARFPAGACGATAEVLCQYLRDAYQLDARYVCGLKPVHQSHAWVIVAGTIIDITADQFELDPVIVTKNSRWHSEWDCEAPRLPDTTNFSSMLCALAEGMERKGG